MARVDVKHVVIARMGDLLGFPEGAVVNFVVKYVKRLVPAWKIPGPSTSPRHGAGAAGHLSPVRVTRDDLAFLQYTGGTTGVPRARCSATATCSPT